MGVRKFIAALAAPAAMLAFPGTAAAADEESLSGFYVAVNAGYGTGSKDWQGPPNAIPRRRLTRALIMGRFSSPAALAGAGGRAIRKSSSPRARPGP